MREPVNYKKLAQDNPKNRHLDHQDTEMYMLTGPQTTSTHTRGTACPRDRTDLCTGGQEAFAWPSVLPKSASGLCTVQTSSFRRGVDPSWRARRQEGHRQSPWWICSVVSSTAASAGHGVCQTWSLASGGGPSGSFTQATFESNTEGKVGVFH